MEEYASKRVQNYRGNLVVFQEKKQYIVAQIHTCIDECLCLCVVLTRISSFIILSTIE